MTFDQLRSQHPVFEYVDYHSEVVGHQLELSFHFLLEPGIMFHPHISIPDINPARWHSLPETLKNNLIFHVGLIEMVSYWKATCSPIIRLRAGRLSSEQEAWWFDLLEHGLGEFWYRNQITFQRIQDIVQFEEVSPRKILPVSPITLASQTAVPLGGGKDSIVSLELLRHTETTLWLWAINPIPATLRIVEKNTQLPFIAVQRTLDPKLLELNQRGYLNGHTPFSALLAFVSVVLSVIFDSDQTAVSNEQSANEENLIWNGKPINHQYSKSYAFETAFREYSRQFLTPSTSYYSLLRPLNELQIAQKLSAYSEYFSDFRSCNVGQKSDSWCHHCAKCLFAFTILFPFIEAHELSHQVFDHNLFDDVELLPLAQSLIQPDLTKPWDCVGTKAESQAAFALCIKLYKDKQLTLPIVLAQLEPHLQPLEKLVANANALLHEFVDEQHLPRAVADLIKLRNYDNH